MPKVDINELRLGSTIEQGVVHIITYNEGKLGVYVLDSPYQSMVTKPFIPIDDCKPLLITTKLFEDNDFTKQLGYYKLLKGEMHKQGGALLEVSQNDIDKNGIPTWYVFYREFNERDNDDLVVLRHDFKFVHELQNIYYDLTKQNLIYYELG